MGFDRVDPNIKAMIDAMKADAAAIRKRVARAYGGESPNKAHSRPSQTVGETYRNTVQSVADGAKTPADMGMATGLSEKTAGNYAMRAARSGYLTRHRENTKHPYTYKITKAGRAWLGGQS